jgi:hypothetical protein
MIGTSKYIFLFYIYSTDFLTSLSWRNDDDPIAVRTFRSCGL